MESTAWKTEGSNVRNQASSWGDGAIRFHPPQGSGGDGLANESIRANGVEPKTMIWVDRVPPAVAQSQTPLQPAALSLKLALDANNGIGDLYLYPNSDSDNLNHRWRLVGVTDGYHMIVSERTGGALDANGGEGNLYLHPNPDRANPNHLWRLEQMPGDYWTLHLELMVTLLMLTVVQGTYTYIQTLIEEIQIIYGNLSNLMA